MEKSDTGKIDKLDRQILEIISKNARTPFKDVAEACGVSRAAIHQRVQKMIESKIILGSGYYINPKVLGYNTCTYIGIRLERGSMYKFQKTQELLLRTLQKPAVYPERLFINGYKR